MTKAMMPLSRLRPRTAAIWSLSGTRSTTCLRALASAFAGGALRELKELYLGGNAIGDAGLIAFAEALEKGELPISWRTTSTVIRSATKE